MIIPIYIPLVLLFLFFAAIAVIAGFQMYHVYSFGVWDRINIGVAAAFLIVMIVLFAAMLMLILATHWSEPVASFSLPSFPEFNAQ